MSYVLHKQMLLLCSVKAQGYSPQTLPDAKSLFLWLLGSLVATEFNSWKKLKRKKISGLEHTEKKNEMAPVYV